LDPSSSSSSSSKQWLEVAGWCLGRQRWQVEVALGSHKLLAALGLVQEVAVLQGLVLLVVAVLLLLLAGLLVRPRCCLGWQQEGAQEGEQGTTGSLVAWQQQVCNLQQ
jgi:hypothetical protein